MDREWNDSQPIYRQLRDRVVAMILDGVLSEGDPLPSVRMSPPSTGSIRSRCSRATSSWSTRTSSRNGAGWACSSTTARATRCCRASAQRFLSEEWPQIRATIQRLGLDAEELLDEPAPSAEEER